MKLKQLKQFQMLLVDFIQLTVPLPRMFFQSLQRTQIKLIVNPNTKKTNTPVIIKNDQTLVVKIDGIINQQFKPNKRPIRKVKKVQIALTSELDMKTLPDPKLVRCFSFFFLNLMLEIFFDMKKKMLLI
jgi:hypothetical protein